MPDLLQIADRLALAELAASYCRAIDRRDFALLESLYHPDAVHDHGAMFRGSPREFADWLRRSMVDMVTQHFVSNALFALDGDRAEGEVYALNCHVIGRVEPRDYIAGGRYLDRYVRSGERWLFAARTRVIDWTHERPSSPAAVAAAVRPGVAGIDDPSYALLPGLVAALRR